MEAKDLERLVRIVKNKYPICANPALNNIPIVLGEEVSTAAVFGIDTEDGTIIPEKIVFNPKFMDLLTIEQQIFVVAHETFHIILKHFKRGNYKPHIDVEREYQKYCETEKDEKLRKIKKDTLERHYHKLWNIATDACINAILQHDGLVMPKEIFNPITGELMRFVDLEEGLTKNAEKIYDELVEKEKEEQNQTPENQNSQESPNNNGGNNGEDDIDIDDYNGLDEHDNWVPKDYEEKKSQNQNKDKQKNEEESKELSTKENKEEIKDKDQNNISSNAKEKENNDSNNQSKKKETEQEESLSPQDIIDTEKKGKEEKTKEQDTKASKGIFKKIDPETYRRIPPKISWKTLLTAGSYRVEEEYNHRRDNKYNVNARVGEVERPTKVTTEVAIDTSGSVSEELIKNFMIEVFDLYTYSEIKIGFFCGGFYGWHTIKTKQDIIDLQIERHSDGTNYEAAATAFSQSYDGHMVNKIVFTDGELDRLPEHTQKTVVRDINWIVFGNKMNFKPKGGRIIKIDSKDLKFTPITKKNDENIDTPNIKKI